MQGQQRKVAPPHSQFEGEYGLPKINQTHPREAGHKPAF